MATYTINSPTPFVTIKNLKDKTVTINIAEAGDVKTGILDAFSGNYKLKGKSGLTIRQKRVDMATLERLAQQNILNIKKFTRTLQYEYTDTSSTGTS